ncbi:MAG: T9SS type A sorting domain-containing protein [Bacteroidota bacterium]
MPHVIGILIFLCLSLQMVMGQLTIERQVIASYGHQVSSGTIDLSATAGETATATLINGSLVLTQGFQQSNLGMVGIEDELLEQTVDYSIYPNPTSDLLTVELTSDIPVNLEVRLYDLRGRALPDLTKVLQGSGFLTYQFNLSELASGRYLLMIKDRNGKGQISHKIEKR